MHTASSRTHMAALPSLSSTQRSSPNHSPRIANLHNSVRHNHHSLYLVWRPKGVSTPFCLLPEGSGYKGKGITGEGLTICSNNNMINCPQYPKIAKILRVTHFKVGAMIKESEQTHKETWATTCEWAIALEKSAQKQVSQVLEFRALLWRWTGSEGFRTHEDVKWQRTSVDI